MDTDRILPDQTVLVQGGRIAAIGPADRVTVPAGAKRIDGRKEFLIPGLTDCHVHLGNLGWNLSSLVVGFSYPDFLADALAEYRLSLFLRDGITTVRNLDYIDRGNDHGGWALSGVEALRLRTRAAAGEIWGPRIYTAGQWAPLQYLHHVTDGPQPRLDSIPAYVTAYKAAGYDFIKVHNESPEVFVAVLAAARQVGIPVVGHATGLLEQALAGGMRSVEHLTGYPRLGDFRRLRTRRSGGSLDTTAYQKKMTEAVMATRHAGVWNCVALGDGGGDMPGTIRALQDAGAGFMGGSDFPAVRLYHEVKRLVKMEGLTPYEALASVTKNFAAYAQTSDETGTIAVGKRADLAMLSGNPLENIEYTEQPDGVMIGGRWRTRKELDLGMKAAEQKVLYGKYISDAVEVRRGQDAWKLEPDSLEQLYHVQRRALFDSLSASADSLTGHPRLLALLARQLGEARRELPAGEKEAFDQRARKWLTTLEAAGFELAIPGVSR